ncbi:competence protein CoiA family protein [Neobacillus sp. NRS-1170]|uniref:competence protein CoiA family protein n=1 Tax=Neobacillus sp. NRS-1170 TaxID=3233898 RepID=UPI003D2E6B1B
MQEAIYEGKDFVLYTYLESKTNRKAEIEQLKKRADKGAFRCPYCDGTLILKSGEIREEHFSHRHSKSCEVSTASEVYHKQIKRESKKHSVMKEIIYEELKSQERANDALDVGYGFLLKAAEKWKYYPDIILKNKDNELAISILTDVTHNDDIKLVKQIKNRNHYFKSKSLIPIWFIESAEQSIDMENRVTHLWEVELDLAIKTPEDLAWEETLKQLPLRQSIFTLFNYYHDKSPASYNVQSLYYVHSTDTNIVFTVQRFIRDEEQYAFRAFALNDGYQMSLSTALLANRSLQLGDPVIEGTQREAFIQTVKQKEVEFIRSQQEKLRLEQEEKELARTRDDELKQKEVERKRTYYDTIDVPFIGRSQQQMDADLKNDMEFLQKSNLSDESYRYKQVVQHMSKFYAIENEIEQYTKVTVKDTVSYNVALRDNGSKRNTQQREVTSKLQNWKIDEMLNHYVNGEAYFSGNPRQWKEIVLNSFELINSNKISIPQLLQKIKDSGIKLAQPEKTMVYPIKEYIQYVTKKVKVISN